jgi:hypothetical protein
MTGHQQKSEARKGEPLERLIERRGDFLRFLEKRVESRTVAEDILQSAFVRGMEKASTLRDEESAVGGAASPRITQTCVSTAPARLYGNKYAPSAEPAPSIAASIAPANIRNESYPLPGARNCGL